MAALWLQGACSHLVTCTLTRTCRIVYLELLMKMHEMGAYKESGFAEKPSVFQPDPLAKKQRKLHCKESSWQVSFRAQLHSAIA